MYYGYVRVSTEKQTEKNQILEIDRYCKFKKIKKIVYYSETISGTKSPTVRKLGELMKQVKEGDTVIITELSRLGRSLMMIFQVLQFFLEHKINVIAIKENYELGDNVQSKVLAFAFGLSAEIERNLISERTKQGLKRVMAEGKKVGRRKGQKSKRYKLTGKEKYIKSELKKGRSKLSLAKELGVTWYTFNTFLSCHMK